jgi:hypothetical protein
MKAKTKGQTVDDATTSRTIGFRCEKCGRWLPLRKRVIYNGWAFCVKHAAEVKAEIDGAWHRAMEKED